MRGKRIVLIDDSIVRGTNVIIFTKMLRDAGAKEIHMRISSPPVKYPLPLWHQYTYPAPSDRRIQERGGDACEHGAGFAGLSAAGDARAVH